MTVKARQQFEKDNKAFKATFIVIVVLMLYYFPILIFRAVLVRYLSKISSEVFDGVFELFVKSCYLLIPTKRVSRSIY